MPKMEVMILVKKKSSPSKWSRNRSHSNALIDVTYGGTGVMVHNF